MQTKVRNNEKYAFCDIPMFYILEHCAITIQQNFPNEVASSKFSIAWNIMIPLRRTDAIIIKTTKIKTNIESCLVFFTCDLIVLHIIELVNAKAPKNIISSIVYDPDKYN